MPAYYARALYDYAPAAGEDELALVKGELVEVVSTEDDDWWRGRARGLEGDFPASYVEVVDGPDEEIAEDGGLSLDGGGSYEEPATPEEELMPAAPPPEDAEPAPPPVEDLGDLPPDWESAEDDAGETYYWNVKTNETSWTKPAADPPKPPAAPPPPKRPEGTPPKKAPHAGRSFKPTTPEKAPERPEEDQPRGGLRGMQKALARAEAESQQLEEEAEAMRRLKVEGTDAAAQDSERAQALREATAAQAAAKSVTPAVPDTATIDLIAKVVNERIKAEFEERDTVIQSVRVAMERLRHELLSQQELLSARTEKRSRARHAASQAPRSSRSENSAMSKMDERAQHRQAASKLRLPRVKTRPQPKTADAESRMPEPKKYARRVHETKAVRTLAAQAAVRYAKCKSTVFAPDGAERAPAEAPESNLWLEHVHGYAGEPPRKGTFGGRNAVWMKDGATAVFPAAALVVVHDPPRNQQRFFNGHAASGEAVTAVSRHPRYDVFASGQAGRRPKVCIWKLGDEKAIEPVADLQLPQGSRHVSHLRFSPCGHLLLSMCADESHTFTLWDWQRAAPLVSQRAGNAAVFGVEFHPALYSITSPVGPDHPDFRVGNLQPDEAQYTLSTCGVRNVKFWTVTCVARPSAAGAPGQLPGGGGASTSPRHKRGSVSGFAPPTQWKVEGNAAPVGRHPELQHVTFTAMAAAVDTEDHRSGPAMPLGRYVLATDRGAVCVWQQLEDDAFPRDQQVDVVDGNASPMMFVRWLARGKCVALHGTAHDGAVLDVGELLVAAQAPLLGAPRSLCWDDAETKLLVGTQGNALAVVEATLTSSAAVDGSAESPEQAQKAYAAGFGDCAREAQAAHAGLGLAIFHHGHVGRVNMLAAHPSLPVMASVGNDRTLRLWDNTDRRLAQLLRLPDRATAVAFHPDGAWLALGTESGDLLLATCESGAGPSARGWAVVQRRKCAAKGKTAKPPGAAQKVEHKGGHVVLTNAAEGHGGDETNAAGVAAPREQEKRCAVTDLKFSPDGANLAACCMDKSIYVFAADAAYKRRLVLKGHSSTPLHLDFSVEGAILQTNDAAHEVLFWDVARGGKQITNAYSLRNTQWASWTCALGWPVQGIFDAETEAHSHEIAAVCRSNKSDVVVAPGANNVLRLMKSPPLAFHADDAKCLSVGGKDATIALWAHFT
ncbi:hypothetical protein JL720_5804 [Aureococcus anophagefferens]|nr:hypothetical protein JL720_5804 [Aureococcus anophagefferens]